MPVTQNRTISLIAAGTAYRESYDSIRQEALRLNSAVNDSTMTLAAAWSELFSHIQYVHPEVDHAVTLATEAEHFRRYGRINERQRLRAQNKRRLRGIPPRPERTDPLARQPILNTVLPTQTADELTEEDVRRMAADLGITADD